MNICIFGDSIAWGACDCQKGGWVERLKSYCMEKYEDISVYNLGISGDSTDDLLKRFVAEATVRNPQLVIFAIGTNDSAYIGTKENHFVSLGRFEDNYTQLIGMARQITGKIVCIGLTKLDESKTIPVPWDPDVNCDNESIAKYDAVLKKISDERGCIYVEMQNSIDVPDLEDGVHPNSRGHEKMFQNILKSINQFLQSEE